MCTNSNFHSGELIFCFNVFFVTCHFYSSLDDGEIKYLVVYLSLTHSFNHCFLCNCIINHMKTPVSSSSPKALVHILFCLCLCSVVLFPPVAMSLTTITTEKTSTTGKQEEKLGSGPSSGLYFLKADLYSGFWTHWLLAQVVSSYQQKVNHVNPSEAPRQNVVQGNKSLLSRNHGAKKVMVPRIMWTWTQTNKWTKQFWSNVIAAMIWGQDLFQPLHITRWTELNRWPDDIISWK